MGLAEKMYFLFPKYGNLGSASLPAGVFEAQRESRLHRGQRTVAWMAAAGMSFIAYEFHY